MRFSDRRKGRGLGGSIASGSAPIVEISERSAAIEVIEKPKVQYSDLACKLMGYIKAGKTNAQIKKRMKESDLMAIGPEFDLDWSDPKELTKAERIDLIREKL